MVVLLFDMGWVEPPRWSILGRDFLKMAPTPSLTQLSHQEVVPSKDTPPFLGHSLAPEVVQSDCFRSQRQRLVVTPQQGTASSSAQLSTVVQK